MHDQQLNLITTLLFEQLANLINRLFCGTIPLNNRLPSMMGIISCLNSLLSFGSYSFNQFETNPIST